MRDPIRRSEILRKASSDVAPQVTQIEVLTRHRSPALLVLLGIWAVLATAGLVGLLAERAGVFQQKPSTGTAIVHGVSPAPQPVSPATTALNTGGRATQSAYPSYTSNVPVAFRGRWDELTLDKCEGREARYELGAHDFANFEVRWDVTRVKLVSPTEIALSLTTKNDQAAQVDEELDFRLADGGQAITTIKPGGDYYRRCP